MKIITKLMAVSLICLAPLGLFANGHGEDEEGKNSKYSAFTSELIKQKGVNLIFEGKLKSKPKSGLNGIWQISNKKVIVDDATIVVINARSSFFKDEDNEVEVFAKRVDGKINAVLIKSE